MAKAPAKRSDDNPDALDDLAMSFEQAIAAFRELRPSEYATIERRLFRDAAPIIAKGLRA